MLLQIVEGLLFLFIVEASTNQVVVGSRLQKLRSWVQFPLSGLVLWNVVWTGGWKLTWTQGLVGTWWAPLVDGKTDLFMSASNVCIQPPNPMGQGTGMGLLLLPSMLPSPKWINWVIISSRSSLSWLSSTCLSCKRVHKNVCWKLSANETCRPWLLFEPQM
jgi:hypothetical protein